VRIARYIRQHHIGLIALFIALTGTAYAGTQMASRPADSQAVKAKKKKKVKLIPGPAGPQGPKGDTGAQGPGATSLISTVPVTPTGLYEPVTTINGLTIEGACSSNLNKVSLRISATTGSGSTLRISGTTFDGTAVQSFDFDGAGGPTNTASAAIIDLDVIARNTAVSGSFTRLDLHVQTNGSAACPVSGMFTPSS
jgi:hypothetical protein